MMQLDLATAEYIGARAQQQDHAAALPMSTGAMLVLADGLGGHESGAEASRIVVETFKAAGADGLFDDPATRRQALRTALERANARIADGVDPAHGHRGMASTVVAAVVAEGELRWVSVGDSHLYVWRDGRLHKLNEDHSQAGLMVRSGQYQPDDPEVKAVKSVLVSALTGRKLEIVDLPPSTFRLEPGDVLMLASDGLNTLSDAEIERIVEEMHEHGAIRLSTTLLESVRSRRVERQDNTTVAIARILEPVRHEAVPAPAERPGRPSSDVIDDASEARTERIVEPIPQLQRSEAVTRPITTPLSSPVETDDEARPVLAEPLPGRAATTGPQEDANQTVATGRRQAHPVETPPAAPVIRSEVDDARSESGPGGGRRAVASGGASPVIAANTPPALSSGIAAADKLARTNGYVGHADPSEGAPPAPASAAGLAKRRPFSARRRSSALVRSVLALVLLVLIVSGVAIAALRPHWLSGVVPGFGNGATSTSAPGAAPQATPNAASAPALVKPPVPATRPLREAPDTPGPDRTAAPPLPDAVSDSPPGGTTESPQTDQVKANAPERTAPSASDPPLIEPERPVTRPAGTPRAP
ncbi:MAG: protein phosphatase 2C domain-containing protein [Hyphomicrobiaceae bacterium]